MGPVAVEFVDKMGEFLTSEEIVCEMERLVNKNLSTEKHQSCQWLDQVYKDASSVKFLQMLDAALLKTRKYQANLINSLPMVAEGEDVMDLQQRDLAVANLRCLHIFYGFHPETFSLAVNLLDRFLCKVKVQPKYLSCVTISCYFIAVKTVEEDGDIPYATELVTLSQCGGKTSDLLRMESIILRKLEWDLNPVTHVTFLHNFYAVFVEKFHKLSDKNLLECMIGKLDVCQCHSGFSAFHPATLALAVISYVLQEYSEATPNILSAVIDLQVYCKIPDLEFIQCRGLVGDFLSAYYGQKIKLPKKKMVWTISRRTMSNLRPSYYHMTDLPTIYENGDTRPRLDSDGMNSPSPFTSEEDLLGASE